MKRASAAPARWLVLIFRLPAKQASARVEVWRRLKRTGALPLAGSGYVLPAQSEAMEQLQWLVASVRKYRGEAAIIETWSLGERSDRDLEHRFIAASTAAYRTVLLQAQRARRSPDPMARRRTLAQLRRRLAEAMTTDFFGSPLRAQVEMELDRVEMTMTRTAAPSPGRVTGRFTRRIWMTRPRPKIDRCASAWLIRKFIDPKAKFVFAARPDGFPRAVPFDMFDAPEGFGHRGDDCTFETLVREFRIRDRRVATLAEMVHDADIGDGKFGRNDAAGLSQVLGGWAQTEVSDAELLRRGMEMFEGLYRGAGAPARRAKRKR
jgi:hypothetical protein